MTNSVITRPEAGTQVTRVAIEKLPAARDNYAMTSTDKSSTDKSSTDESAQTSRTQGFLDLHIPGQPLIMPNPWDVGSAKILHSLGFKALATTSAGFAHASGKPDATLAVSRAEAIEHARQIVEATTLPVNGDLERGFGDAPEDAATTITQAGAAGLAGASIEDSTSRPEDPIFDRSFAIERVAAAVEAARAVPGGFVLTARAEGFLWGHRDLDEVIARLTAFEAAGADVVYAPALPSLDAVAQVVSSVGVPVNVLAKPEWTVAEIGDTGAARISLGSKLSMAAYSSLFAAANEILESGSFTFAEGQISFNRLNKIFGSE